jgi:hypothetical protein
VPFDQAIHGIRTLRAQADAARDAAGGELSDTYQAEHPTRSVSRGQRRPAARGAAEGLDEH